MQNPRYENVDIFTPAACNPNIPNAFCSNFGLSTPEQCNAILGSPVVCGNEQTVSGFVIGSNGTCLSSASFNKLNYHSVGDFRQWIEQVSGAQTAGPIALLLVLSAFVLSFKTIL